MPRNIATGRTVAPTRTLAGVRVLTGDIGNVVTNGLVGYWKMDEPLNSWNGTTGEVIDSSGNGNNGTGVGYNGTQSPVLGKYGNAGSFGATRYVKIGSQSQLKPTIFSISTWVNISSTGAGDGNIIAGESDAAGSDWQYGYYLYVYSNQIIFSVGSSSLYKLTFNYTASQWYHVVGTFDGTNMYLYVNGALIGSMSAVLSYAANNTFTIGHGTGYTSFVNGLIDDTRIYNRALSASEVQQLYLSPGVNRTAVT